MRKVTFDLYLSENELATFERNATQAHYSTALAIRFLIRAHNRGDVILPKRKRPSTSAQQDASRKNLEKAREVKETIREHFGPYSVPRRKKVIKKSDGKKK